MNGMNDGVLIVYTGGTIGSVHDNLNEPLSPLRPGTIEELLVAVPAINQDRIAFGDIEVRIGTIGFKPLLDSSNIGPKEWKDMALTINHNYEKYEGFVILHGTDTMAYTTSALAFMLEHLNKPIIITGSQKPIGETRSDAVQNLVTAIEIAAAKSLGKTIVPEVCLFFRDTLLRGCRATKISADAYTGFDSPNCPPLGIAGEHIEINKKLIRTPSKKKIKVNSKLETNIAALDIFPGMSPTLLRNFLETEGLKGVVLKTFGTGNIPTYPEEILDAIGDAVDNGIIVVDVIQCLSGTVELGLYEVSAGLLERGVISGQDMTTEAALTKMAVLLADEEAQATPSALMRVNLCGEQDKSIFELDFEEGIANPDNTIYQQNRIEAPTYFNTEKITNANLNILGFELEGANSATVDLSVFIGDSSANKDSPKKGSHYVPYKKIRWDGKTRSIFIDVTEPIKMHLDPTRRLPITIVSDSGHNVKWTKLKLLIFTEGVMI